MSFISRPPPSLLFPSATGESTRDPGAHYHDHHFPRRCQIGKANSDCLLVDGRRHLCDGPITDVPIICRRCARSRQEHVVVEVNRDAKRVVEGNCLKQS